MTYFFLNHQNPKGGFVDGDVTFDPPLTDYYYNGQPLPGDAKSVTVVMDKAVKRLKVDLFLTTSGAFLFQKIF